MRYNALSTIGKWGGAEKKASAFKAGDTNKNSPPDSTARRHKYPTREAWFDAQVCKHPGCNGNHPTWAHDDPVGKRSIKPRRTLPSKQRSKQLKFRSPSHKKKFQEAVHNALIDACDDDDEEEVSSEEQEYINMADADGFDGEDDAGVSEGADGDAVDEQEPMVSALVAAGLGNLLLKD